MDTRQAISAAAQLIESARSLAAFTGAGMSTESGIPDFRSPGGVWATSQPVYYDDFVASPAARREYWRQKAASHDDFFNNAPNVGHRILAKWQESGRLWRLITQNIDGLHQLAGSTDVFELHGTAREVACLQCESRFDADVMVRQFRETNTPPNCPKCGGITKHATISFGQQLTPAVLMGAAQSAAASDVFLAMGSSLVVHPAASLPEIAKTKGASLIIINREATPLDPLADVVIRAPLGATLQAIDEMLSSDVKNHESDERHESDGKNHESDESHASHD